MVSFMSRLSFILFLGSLFCTTTTATEASLRGVGLATDAPTDPPADPEELGSLAAIAVSDPDLSILVELVTLASLGPTLETPGPFTVFAPTNDAFAEILLDLDNLESLETQIDQIIQILLYHVVAGAVTSTDISDGLLLETIQGETILFDVNDDGVFVNEEVISAVDIMASNGVVHKIDGVLFPQSVLDPTSAPDVEITSAPEELGSLAAVAVSDPDLSILVELVTLVSLGGALGSPGPFTVFAPTNDAFAEVIIDLDNLEILDADIVFALLTYHVVSGIFMSGDISDGLLLTTLEGETILFDVNDDGVFVNEEVISAVDIMASNGVVHKIDGVMFPQSILDPTEAPTGAPEEPEEATEIADLSPETEVAVEDPPGNIVDVLKETNNVSVFNQVVSMASFGDVLSTGDYTVFAPTNTAFFAKISELEIDIASDESTSKVAGVMTYHVVEGVYMASDLTDGLTLTTVQGESIVFSVDGDAVKVNDATVEVSDIAASNGVIHVINDVLVPESEKAN